MQNRHDIAGEYFSSPVNWKRYAVAVLWWNRHRCHKNGAKLNKKCGENLYRKTQSDENAKKTIFFDLSIENPTLSLSNQMMMVERGKKYTNENSDV